MTHLRHKLNCLTKSDPIHYQRILLHFWVLYGLEKRTRVITVTESKYITITWLTTSIESQLSTDYYSIQFIPEVITHSAIDVIVADLHSSLPLAISWCCAIHQSNLAISAIWSAEKVSYIDCTWSKSKLYNVTQNIWLLLTTIYHYAIQ